MLMAFTPSLALSPRASFLFSKSCRSSALGWSKPLQKSRLHALPPLFNELRMTAEAPETPNASSTSSAGISVGKASVGAVLLGFIAFTAIGPQNWASPGALADVASLNFDAVNSIFLGALGLSVVQSFVHLIFLSPGLLVSLPCTLLGFPAVAPVMLLQPSAAQPSDALSKRSASLAGASLALAALVCYASAFSFGAPAETRDVYFYSACLTFSRALADDPWLRLIAANAAALALAAPVPLAADMSRRGWKFSGQQKLESFAALASVAALPGFGPALYIALRPPVRRREGPAE